MAKDILGVLGSGLDDYGDSPIPGSRRDKLLRLAETLKAADLSEVKRDRQGQLVQRTGGIGNIRDIGDPNDSRRNTPVPQQANIPGIPGAMNTSPNINQAIASSVGENIDFKNAPSLSPSPEDPELPRVSRQSNQQTPNITSERKESGQMQESNLAKILRGESSSGIVRQPSMLSGRFENVRKKPTEEQVAEKIPGDIIAQTPTGTVGGERINERQIQERMGQAS